MEQVDVDGTRICFERNGDGVPLLLLHGLPGDSRIWRRQLQSLADEFTVVAWDAPGCGRSSDPSEPSGTSDVARCLAAFVDRIGLDRPHIAGLSWGVGIALALYEIAPNVPRSLVLASGYAGWAGSLPADAVTQRLDAYVAASRLSPQEAVATWGPGFVSDAAPTAIVDEIAAIAADFHPGPLAALARSFAETDLRPMLSSISVPTLVLQAEADARSPMFVGEDLHARIPRSQLVVLPGVGHVSNVEDPETFDEAVRSFLRAVPL
jgi:pimeloyl-ACP methyl ester carboxylesterase